MWFCLLFIEQWGCPWFVVPIACFIDLSKSNRAVEALKCTPMVIGSYWYTAHILPACVTSCSLIHILFPAVVHQSDDIWSNLCFHWILVSFAWIWAGMSIWLRDQEVVPVERQVPGVPAYPVTRISQRRQRGHGLDQQEGPRAYRQDALRRTTSTGHYT